MRIDRPESRNASQDRARHVLDVAWQRFARMGRAARVAAVAGLLVMLVALGFLASMETAARRVSLYPQHRFASEDAQRLVNRLSSKGIAATSVAGRVEVPVDKLTQAYAEVEKAGLEPLSPRQRLDQTPEVNLWLRPDQIVRQDRREYEKFLEDSLREIDPSLSAIVQIQRDSPRGLSREGNVRVTVELNLDQNRPIPPELIEKARNKVRAYLEPDQLTLMDSKGRIYESANDPDLGRRTLQEARQDTLRAELLAGLDWIDGVRVAVAFEPGMDLVNELLEMVRPEAVASAEPLPAVGVNEPIALTPEPPPAPVPAAPPSLGKASVTVLVPNAYYSRVASSRNSERGLSAGDLQSLVARTEASIRRVILSKVSPTELGSVTIDRIFTQMPEDSQPNDPAAALGQRLPEWWPIAVGAMLAVGLGLAMMAGSHLRSTNHAPRRAGTAAPRRPHFDVGVDEDAGPSERVGALIRQDPAAAAGVLRRWIGQGGHDA